ncbi:MAG: hypothetical protein HY659_12830 [Rhizobiales bacterium]|nr:hypothetical protein [Hyphomicrobiales bacterium]
MTATDATFTKLPFWRTVGHSYALWLRNFPELIRFAWLWLAVMVPVFAVLMWWQAPLFAELIQAAGTNRQVSNPGFLLLIQVISTVAMLPILSSLAVAWHRLLLRDERVASSIYLRLDRVVIGYAGLLFITGVMASAPQYASQLYDAIFLEADVTESTVISILGFIGSIIGLFIAGRLFMVLPARALDRTEITFADAWSATRRNGWRLFFGYFLCILPIGVFAGLVSLKLVTLNASQLVVVALWVAVSVAEILGGLIAVGFLSLAYRYFFEAGRNPR